MRQPLLIGADKTVIESATSWLGKGIWRVECDCCETELILSNGTPHTETFTTEGTHIKVQITKRGPKELINIYAVRC